MHSPFGPLDLRSESFTPLKNLFNFATSQQKNALVSSNASVLFLQ